MGGGYWKTYLVYTAFLIVPLLIMFAAALQSSSAGSGLRPTWSLAALAVLWSGMSVTVFRMLIRHRYATTISLTAAGIEYCAPQIGIIPAKEVFVRYEDILSVAPIDHHHPDLIVVHTTTGTFSFDRRTMAELTTLGASGRRRNNIPCPDLYREIEMQLKKQSLPVTAKS